VTTTAEIFNIKNPEHRAFIPDGTFMLAYRGSIAHNMYVPGFDPKSIDDVDLMGVVIGSPENYFGLREWGQRGTKEVKQHQYDCVFYEIRKMFSLLLQGNPNVLSMLWLRPEDYLFRTSAADVMIRHRDLFAGKHVYNAFAGYAHQQLSKMETREPAEIRDYLALTYEAKFRGIHPNEKGNRIEYPDDYDLASGEARNASAHTDDVLITHLRHYMKKGENLGYLGDKRKHLVLDHGYDAKNAAHCIRLLRMAAEYLRTGELIVFRPDAAELLDIKLGRWSLERIKAHADELFTGMRSARDASPLPDEPDRDGAEKLLVKILRENIA
jgi:predicted nucleotidyltransferase